MNVPDRVDFDLIEWYITQEKLEDQEGQPTKDELWDNYDDSDI